MSPYRIVTLLKLWDFAEQRNCADPPTLLEIWVQDMRTSGRWSRVRPRSKNFDVTTHTAGILNMRLQ